MGNSFSISPLTQTKRKNKNQHTQCFFKRIKVRVPFTICAPHAQIDTTLILVSLLFIGNNFHPLLGVDGQDDTYMIDFMHSLPPI